MRCIQFGYIWPSGFREEVKNVNSLQTDEDRQPITDDQKSSLEQSVQLS